MAKNDRSSMKNILDVLNGNKSLSFNQIYELFLHFGETRTFSPGTSIILENQISKNVIMVLSGTVKVMKEGENGDKITIARLERGSIAGELSLFLGNQRKASIIAETTVEIVQLSAIQFLKLFSVHPTIQYYLLTSLSKRIDHTNNILYQSYQKVRMLKLAFRLMQEFHDQNEQSSMVGTVRISVPNISEILNIDLNIIRNKIKELQYHEVIANCMSDGNNNITFQMNVNKLRILIASYR